MQRYLIKSATTTYDVYDAMNAEHALALFAEDSDVAPDDLDPDVVATEVVEPVAAGFVVLQEGHAIYGVGATQAEAWDDAREFVVTDSDGEDSFGDLTCEPCSQALIDEVRAKGAPSAWATVDDVHCTLQEAA